MGNYILVYENNCMEDNVSFTERIDCETEKELHDTANEILKDKDCKIIVSGYLIKEFEYKAVKKIIKYEPIECGIIGTHRSGNKKNVDYSEVSILGVDKKNYNKERQPVLKDKPVVSTKS